MESSVHRDLPQELKIAASARWRIRVAEAAVITTRLVLLAISAAVALDALVRFPVTVRWGLLLAVVVWLAVLMRRWLMPAIAKRESVVSLALVVESEHEDLEGRVASGVEFAQSPAFAGSALARAVAVAAGERTPRSAVQSLVSWSRLRREALGLSVVMAAWCAFAIINPTLALTGAERLLMPWVMAEWPARTSVRSTTFATHHPRRTALPLRADLFRGDPLEEPVWVRMRLVTGDTTSDWTEMPLVHQGETRFERLIEPAADAVEFHFLTRDMETQAQRIDFVDAPTVSSVKATISPPAYAASAQPEMFDLGRATDSRGRVPIPVLEGSRIDLAIETTPHIPLPTGDKAEEWRERTLVFSGVSREGSPQPPTLECEEIVMVWHIRWMADVSRVLSLRLVDAHGVRNIDEITITVDVVADIAPEATMLEPSADETVLPTAALPLRGEARDDVGVTTLTLHVRRGEEWQRDLARQENIGARHAEVIGALDLGELGASPGDVFEVTCVATDAFVSAGTPREPTRSSPRRIRVLSRAQFDEETRNALAVLRQGALRVGERQRALIDRKEAAQEQLRPQSEIGERLKALHAALDALGTRAQRNRIQDDAEESLREAATDMLEEARAQADGARDALQRATDDANNPAAIEEAQAHQEAVRQEIEDLAALLDRDKDAWAAAKSLERVAQSIARADEARRKAGASTMGKTPAELTSAEAAELDRAAESANQAAKTAAEAIEELRERSEQVSQKDPSRAGNLRQAAQRGESEAVSTRMEEAEAATRENKLDEARQASAAAAESVQRMMEDLVESEKTRTATLRRRLADLSEALEAIVREAQSVEEQGLALKGPAAPDVATAAVGTQAASVSRTALGVAEEARTTGPEAQRVVRLVERGAESEGRAATALLATPAQVAAGHEALVRATMLFKEALDAARAQERRTEEEQRQERMRELSQRYRVLAEKQEGILTATVALTQGDGGRRALVEGRRLGVAESEIAAEIAAIPEESEDVKQSGAFMEASTQAREAALTAAERLGAGPPLDGAIDAVTELLEILKGLALALDQAAERKDDPFGSQDAEGGSQGGGAGGGGAPQDESVIPPLAELRVLRALQKAVNERTRRAGATGATEEATRALAARQDGVAKLAEELRAEVEQRMREGPSGNAPVKITPPDEPREPGDDAERNGSAPPKESEP